MFQGNGFIALTESGGPFVKASFGKCAVNDMLVSMFQNGFAVVRPPGHHADPSNPM